VLEGAGYATRPVPSGEEALECAAAESLALVVLDICLPGISGYQVCKELKDEFGDALPILFVSGARTESYDRVACLLVGGDDYLAKPVAPDELLIRVSRLIRHSRPLAPSVVTRLTPRELEVLRLLAEGLGPHEVAGRLVISPKTVATHIDHILSKLGVHSRAQAVAVALQHDASPSIDARAG
jgi:DNA-binding NarL/FixJ family response regulator